MRDGAKDLIKNFVEYYIEKTNKNIFEANKSFDIGFYILNKIDLMTKNDKKEDIIKDFLKNYSSITTDSDDKISIYIQKDINFIDICAKELCDNFKIEQIIREILKESINSEYNSFKRFINKFLKNKYNIDIKKSNEVNEDKNLEPKLLFVNQLLKNNCQKFFNDEPKLNLKEYTYINNLIPEQSNSKSDGKVKVLIQQKIKRMLDEILTFKLNGLIKEIISKDQIQKLNKVNNNKKQFYPDEFIKEFSTEVEKLFVDHQDSNTNNKYSKIKDILTKIKDFKNYYNNKKIRIIFLGKISSGKTSLMNSIIGHNYNILN